MSRITIPCLLCLAAMGLFLQPAPASASEKEWQLWTLASAETDIAADTPLVADIGYRFRDETSGPDQYLLRVNVDTAIDPAVRIGGGAAHFRTGHQGEWRGFERVTLVHGGWSSRTQFEQRFFDGADRAELRLRERIQYTHRVDDRTRVFGSGEWLVRVQAKQQGGATGTDQLRATLGMTRDLGGGYTASLAYLLIHQDVAGGEDRLAHVPQFSVLRRF